MPRSGAFDQFAERYERWFETNRLAYESELRAVRQLLPDGEGVEIGVGSGRFAEPLGIKQGVEPSSAMRAIALSRGIDTVEGVAEALPYDDGRFDFALMVTTICFVDDPAEVMREAYRVLKPGGALVVGFVDRASPLGKKYEEGRDHSVFYREAVFYSIDEVINYLEDAGFGEFVFSQTIFRDLAEIHELEPAKPAYGEGSFVVVRGVKPANP